MTDLRLSPKEMEVLQFLPLKGTTITELCQKMRDSRDFQVQLETQLRSIFQGLFVKQLISSEKRKVTQTFSLSEEGAKYAKVGLPEKRLLKYLLDKAIRDRSALKTLWQDKILQMDKKEYGIALKWALEKGWIRFEAMKIIYPVTNLEKLKGPDEELLKLIAENDELQSVPRELSEGIKSLIKRGLISAKDLYEEIIQPTDLGIQIAKSQILVEIKRKSYITSRDIETGDWERILGELKAYSTTEQPPLYYVGKKHPYLHFLEKVKRILIGLGFEEARGGLVETEFWNFDALFQAQDHVAREIHGTFHLKSPQQGRLIEPDIVERVGQTHENGWETNSTGWSYKWSPEQAMKLVLRTQGTAVSARFIAKNPPLPVKMFCIDRVFRPEKLDATHSMEFYQLEGIVIDEGLTLRHLMGFMQELALAMGLKSIRFKPGYFPFTEPSVEAFVYHEKLGIEIEALGAGIFRPEVTYPLGIKEPVLAWGIGFDRLAMAALGISDIRDLSTTPPGDLSAWKENKQLLQEKLSVTPAAPGELPNGKSIEWLRWTSYR